MYCCFVLTLIQFLRSVDQNWYNFCTFFNKRKKVAGRIFIIKNEFHSSKLTYRQVVLVNTRTFYLKKTQGFFFKYSGTRRKLKL